MQTSLCVMDAVITELQTNNGWKSSGELPHHATSSRTKAFKNECSLFKTADIGCVWLLFAAQRVGVNATAP